MEEQFRRGNLRRVKSDRRYYDRRTNEERRRLPEEKLVKKILVTGDRNWDDITQAVEVLKCYRAGTILVHGSCRGADIICAAVGEALGLTVRGYPADWKKHGNAAGPIRNQQMLDAEHQAGEPIDLCLAFHNDLENSHGTADMVRRIEKASIPWKLITSHPRSSAEQEHQPAKLGVVGSNPAEDTALTLEQAKELAEEGRALGKEIAAKFERLHGQPSDPYTRFK